MLAPDNAHRVASGKIYSSAQKYFDRDNN